MSYCLDHEEAIGTDLLDTVSNPHRWSEPDWRQLCEDLHSRVGRLEPDALAEYASTLEDLEAAGEDMLRAWLSPSHLDGAGLASAILEDLPEIYGQAVDAHARVTSWLSALEPVVQRVLAHGSQPPEPLPEVVEARARYAEEMARKFAAAEAAGSAKPLLLLPDPPMTDAWNRPFLVSRLIQTTAQAVVAGFEDGPQPCLPERLIEALRWNVPVGCPVDMVLELSAAALEMHCALDFGDLYAQPVESLRAALRLAGRLMEATWQGEDAVLAWLAEVDL